MTTVSIFLEILFGMGALSLAAAWMTIPQLQNYALQAFAVAAILYIVIKKVSKDSLFYTRDLDSADQIYKVNQGDSKKKKKIPYAQIINLAILGFAVTLLVGYFGGMQSAGFAFAFVYIFFLAFSTGTITTISLTLFMLTLVFYLTPEITAGDFVYPVLAVVFMSVVMLAKKYYDQSVIKQHSLKIEREKVTYYNIYAENQLNESLRTQRKLRELSQSGHDTREFVKELVAVIDDLTKKSRHTSNQMIVSQELNRIGFNLRSFQSGLTAEDKVKSTADQTEAENTEVKTADEKNNT